jgi:hypothetical protein
MTRIRKQLPIPGGDADNDRIWCNWEDCENPSSNLQRVIICHAAPRFRHQGGLCAHCEIKTFCREQHKDFWARSHLPGQFGKLSAGVNGVYLLWAGPTRSSKLLRW